MNAAARPPLVHPRWVGLALFVSMAALFIQTSAPGPTPGDAGELIAAAATLSIPHPPSFPLYVLMAKAFTVAFPFGSLPYRVVLFSALCAAAGTTCGFFFFLRASRKLAASLLCAIAISLSAPLWMNAIVAEVFALHRLFIALFLTVIVAASQGAIRPAAAAVLFAFLGGVTSANHQTVVFAAPAYFVFAWLIRPFSRFLRVTAVAVGFAAVGLSLTLFLPIRSSKSPPLDWGHPATAENFYRTISRKDYGTLTLALGEKPARTAANTGRQLARFARTLTAEAGWPLIILGLAGLAIGIRRREPIAFGALALMVSSGPLFFLLGNLPFDAQSEGVIQRFYVAPIIALAAGCASFIPAAPGLAIVLGAAGVAVGLGNAPAAAAHRDHTLVADYARSMLRALPPRATLILDGGDDSFYGLTSALYAEGRRPDVSVHDRGGLIFRSPYGNDFRRLSPAAKEGRRQSVERDLLDRGPLFYCTMNESALGGVRLAPRAFLREARGEGPGYDWPLACLRSIHPSPTSDYRTRALAAFFPYMRGVGSVSTDPELALRAFRRAAVEAGDVDWLRANLSQTYAFTGHRFLTEGRFALARRAFADWSDFDPDSEAALNNLGVSCERLGQDAEAERWYREAAARFPRSVDPVYNLGAIAWKRGDWKAAADGFQETLRRDPRHPSAANFLAEARRRGGGGR